MKLSARIIIDIVATVIYIICANPLITGLAVHEWLSLGIIIVFVVHVAINLDTVTATIKRKTQSGAAGILNLVLDIAILACFMLVTVSGILVSRHVLPALGAYAQGYWLWMPLHSVTAKLLLALLIVHVATHIKWFTALLSRSESKADKN